MILSTRTSLFLVPFIDSTDAPAVLSLHESVAVIDNPSSHGPRKGLHSLNPFRKGDIELGTLRLNAEAGLTTRRRPLCRTDRGHAYGAQASRDQRRHRQGRSEAHAKIRRWRR